MRAAHPETPAAPQLRAIREAWLGQATECLEADPATGSDQATWSVDARHNVPRGAGAVGVCYIIDGLPLFVDWYVYPRSGAAWVADATIIFDPDGLPRLHDTFDEQQGKRELQPPTPKAANAHRLLPVSLLPVAAKYVARRSADAGRMVGFVGGSDSPEATPAERIASASRLLLPVAAGTL